MADSSEFKARSRALAPDFVLDREIGRGGMGIVYLGTDVKLDRAVAIKVLPELLAEAKPLTATGQVLGTVHYMSPEQITGEHVDGRSDLYSLGVVGFRALTGRLPFDNEVASAVLVAHVVKLPPKVRDVAPHVS